MIRCLVRQGRLERLAWFGTIHAIDVRRDAIVVTHDVDGLWIGTVLRQFVGDEASAPAPHGEILRLATHDDQQVWLSALQVAETLRDHAVELCQERPQLPLVLDADVDLNCSVGIIQYAGQASHEMGQAAVELAKLSGLTRVRWEAAANDSDAPHSTRNDQPWKATPLKTAEPSSSLRQLTSLLDERDRQQVNVQQVKRLRLALGTLGAYLQKVRPEPAPNAHTPQELAAQHVERKWMVRLRTGTSTLTPKQFERLTKLATDWGNSTLRLTMRQGFQLHGVGLGDARQLLQELDAIAVDTRGTCGNSLRNVTVCPLEPTTAKSRMARKVAMLIARRFTPDTRWFEHVVRPLGNDDQFSDEKFAEIDHAYPNGYPPHKWKVGVATDDDNCVDVLTNDVGLVIREHGPKGLCVDCFLGGSTAYRLGQHATTASLAQPFASLPCEQVETAMAAVLEVYRRVSSGQPRRSARLKNTLKQLGLREFESLVLQELGGQPSWWQNHSRILPPKWNSHEGWFQQENGKWTIIRPVPAGRLGTANQFLVTASLDKWSKLAAQVDWIRAGPRHSLVLGGVSAINKESIETDLRVLLDGPLQQTSVLSAVPRANDAERLNVLTCVALPTCPLALADAERAYNEWRAAIRQCEADLSTGCSQPAGEPLVVAVSGCPNGCSHPLTANLGIIAEGPQRYRVFAGGNGLEIGAEIGTVSGPDDLHYVVRKWVDERNERT